MGGGDGTGERGGEDECHRGTRGGVSRKRGGGVMDEEEEGNVD